jgi:hypothetical protein
VPHRSLAVQSTAHANAFVERFIGSIRRECLDQIVLNAAGLHRVLTDYVTYYMRSRTHLGSARTRRLRGRNAQDAGPVVAIPEVNGLHRRYVRVAA